MSSPKHRNPSQQATAAASTRDTDNQPYQHHLHSHHARYDTIRSCVDQDITNAVAAAKLGIKIRQVQKLKRAVKENGERGVLHGNHSRVPWNATAADTRKSVVAFLKKKNHRDFGPTFAMEQLAKQEKITLPRNSAEHYGEKETMESETAHRSRHPS